MCLSWCFSFSVAFSNLLPHVSYLIEVMIQTNQDLWKLPVTFIFVWKFQKMKQKMFWYDIYWKCSSRAFQCVVQNLGQLLCLTIDVKLISVCRKMIMHAIIMCCTCANIQCEFVLTRIPKLEWNTSGDDIFMTIRMWVVNIAYFAQSPHFTVFVISLPVQ
jgi:hypothetical protein